MSKRLIPKSRARTAYGLLSEIAKLSLAEPKRMRMSMWLDKADYDVDDEDSFYPRCGTVGCIAGWAVTLKPTRARTRETMWGPEKEDEGYRAQRRLGLSDAQHIELFRATRLVNARNEGTPAHARAVVAHIRKFQTKYRVQLKATKV